MSKHKHYPNPRTNGNTGTYVKYDGVDPNLVAAGIICLAAVVLAGAAYLFGYIRGENVTIRQKLIDFNVINDDNDTES